MPELILPPGDEAERKKRKAAEEKAQQDEFIKKFGEFTERKAVKKLSSLLLLNWRVFYLIRMRLEEEIGDEIDERMMSCMMQAIAEEATKEFKVGRVKNDMKRVMLPFLRGLATDEVKGLKGRLYAQQGGGTKEAEGVGEPSKPGKVEGEDVPGEHSTGEPDPSVGEGGDTEDQEGGTGSSSS